jgi:hypothetical protein
MKYDARACHFKMDAGRVELLRCVTITVLEQDAPGQNLPAAVFLTSFL